MTEIERLLGEQLRALETQRSREIQELRGFLSEQALQFEDLRQFVSTTLEQYATMCTAITQDAAACKLAADQAVQAVSLNEAKTAEVLTDLITQLNNLNNNVDRLAEVVRN